MHISCVFRNLSFVVFVYVCALCVLQDAFPTNSKKLKEFLCEKIAEKNLCFLCVFSSSLSMRAQLWLFETTNV